ncbi:PadR family transcriptional regulator [Thermogladius sp. 4427co]|uniref:PadR family transcriptional regulator n=1 Tax=Thermogladius sp. 4427co TaxID=3450718 RepID=UPI003F793903
MGINIREDSGGILDRVKALERLKRKLTVENLWLYVTKVLIDNPNPLRAYDIRRLIKEKYGISPPAITVYTVIYRMTREGLLTRVSSGDQTFYRVSEKGIETFKLGLGFIEQVLNLLKGES